MKKWWREQGGAILDYDVGARLRGCKIERSGKMAVDLGAVRHRQLSNSHSTTTTPSSPSSVTQVRKKPALHSPPRQLDLKDSLYLPTPHGPAHKDPHVITVTRLQLALDDASSERDFFFEKLQKIEAVVLATSQSDDAYAALQRIKAIIYETEDGFCAPIKPDAISVEQQSSRNENKTPGYDP